MIVLSANRVLVIRACLGVMMGAQVVTFLHARKLQKANEELVEQYRTLSQIASYLIRLCEEQNVEITEFDAIAINMIAEGRNATGR